MYGLLQLGLLAQELLAARLATHGYAQSKLTPGLWTCKTRPIQFCLAVDNFGVKYIGTDHAVHLKNILEQNYQISTNWGRSKYVELMIDWDYSWWEVHLSMLGYVQGALACFQPSAPSKTTATATSQCTTKLWTKITICRA